MNSLKTILGGVKELREFIRYTIRNTDRSRLNLGALAYLDSVDVPTMGTYTTTSDGVATSYNIPHGLGAIVLAVVNAVSADAKNIAYIATDGTNITVHYTVAPPAGSNNLTYHYICQLASL